MTYRHFLILTLGWAACLAAITVSVAVNFRMGYMSLSEGEAYISHYLSPQNVITKIFDYRGNDYAAIWRAREFSNLVNFLDTQALVVFARLKIPHLLSTSHYLGLLAVVLLTYLTVFRKKPAERVLGIILTLIFLTAPAPFFSGYYFRSSKIIVAVYSVLMAYLLGIKKPRFPLVYQFIAFTASLAAAWSDELGIVMVFIWGTIAISRSRIDKKIPFFRLGIPVLSVLPVIFLYRLVLGPIIVGSITGTRPGLWQPSAPASPIPADGFYRGISLFAEYLKYYAGNFGFLSPALVFLGMSALFSGPTGYIVRSRNKPAVIILSVAFSASFFAAFGLLLTVMAISHPVILWKEYILTYYPLPFYGFIHSLGLISLPLIIQNKSTSRLAAIGGVTLIILNLVNLPRYERELTSPPTISWVYYHQAGPILEAVASPTVPLESFKLEHDKAADAIRKAIIVR